MVNFLIDLVLVFWMLLFGGMALLPILTGDRREREPEDIVLHITPVRPSGITIGERLPARADRPQSRS